MKILVAAEVPGFGSARTVLERLQDLDRYPISGKKTSERRVSFNNIPELGGGFKHFLFSSLLGEMIQFDEYFSNGLKPPTRYPRDPGSPKLRMVSWKLNTMRFGGDEGHPKVII